MQAEASRGAGHEGVGQVGMQARGMGGTARRGERGALRHCAYALQNGQLGTHDTALGRLRHGLGAA